LLAKRKETSIEDSIDEVSLEIKKDLQNRARRENRESSLLGCYQKVGHTTSIKIGILSPAMAMLNPTHPALNPLPPSKTPISPNTTPQPKPRPPKPLNRKPQDPFGSQNNTIQSDASNEDSSDTPKTPYPKPYTPKPLSKHSFDENNESCL
jgi:hypothetical protein